MNISNSLLNWYRKLKQVLEDSNIALNNKGLNRVVNLCEVSTEIDKLSEINYLPYLLRNELLEVTVENIGEITTINSLAFESCTSLESITIPDSVITIGNNAFSSCPSLTSVTIGNNVTTVGNYAFSSCPSLESITIPDSVITIGNNAFSSCPSLTSVTIGNNVTTVGNEAFSYNTSLTNVTIPDSVTTIDSYAFYRSLLLTEIYLKPTTPPTLGNTDAIPTTTIIHVPIGSGNAYKSATNWSYHSARIVEDIVV